MSRRNWLGLALLAAVACGGETADDTNGGGAGEPGCEQLRKCATGLGSAIEQICVDDACVNVGVRENGAVVTSDMYVFTRYPAGAAGLRSFAMTVLHPTRPDGERLTCADLLALAPEKRRGVGYTNVLEWSAGRLTQSAGSDTFPAQLTKIAVNEPGVKYLLLAELWTGDLDTISGENTGLVGAEGCAEDFVAVPGPYLDGEGQVIEEHTFLIQAHARPLD